MSNRTVPATAEGMPATDADAALVCLGAELEGAWVAQDAIEEAGGDGFDEAYAISLAIVRRIEALPALTLAGLRVKARVVEWCHSGEPIAVDSFEAGDTADMRMVAAIIRDLLATQI